MKSIVSFKPMGRLGNFLFTAAATIAYAKKHDIEFSTPTETNDQHWNPIYLRNLISPRWVEWKKDITISELEYYRFDEILWKEEWKENKQIELRGYFQNELYFKDYRKTILDTFNFPWQLNTGTVSVHVRRGDYLKLTEKHPPVSKEWITKAMKEFPGKDFVFFSDDIDWCRKNFGHRVDCIFVKGNTELQDLITLSHCEHHINSASTFSWIGAWLNRNENKKVVLPQQWLMPQSSNQWTEEIVPKKWIRL